MRYRILAPLLLLALAAAPARAQITNAALMDTLQHSACDYFWYTMNPATGLMPDRSTPTSPCSIASEGFGLSAICVAVDHGWVPRDSASARVRIALETFWNGPQNSGTTNTMGYKGLFYHFLDMNTGLRTWTSELSTIDTALLLAGILDCKRFFDDPSSANEARIRALADSIYYRVDWTFVQNPNINPSIYMGWTPENGFSGFGNWIGYNEGMILYILAMGSPTHPVPAACWNTWTSGYVWATQYGLTYVLFPPLFGHQYSHCWIDFRNIADFFMQSKGITYFENSKRATLAQRRYCTRNPLARVGYADSLWGLTASDDPYSGYLAHGAPPTQNDNGTITPTAALSSIPFAPDTCLQVARTLWNNYRPQMWGPYGFVDAFNLTRVPAWYDTDYLGIDQGPIALMIENYRTQAIWNRMMGNADIVRGLTAAGFVPTAGVPAPPVAANDLATFAAPNPFTSATAIHFRLAQAGSVRLTVYDLAGREVVRLLDGVEPAGEHVVPLGGAALRSGVYYYRLEAGGRAQVRKCVRLE